MNTKYILIGGLVIIILLGAVAFVLSSQKNNPAPITSEQQSQTQESQESSPTPTPGREETVEVSLTSSGFSPKEITIAKGTKVVWVNNSGKTATVNSGPHPVHTSYQPLNLGNFNDGQNLEVTFNETGTFKYHNHLNASQTGSVTVE